MQNFAIWVYTAMAATALLSLFSMALFLAMRKQFLQSKTDTDKQLRMSHSSVMVMGKRILELEQRIADLRKNQQSLNDQDQDYAYSKARTLLSGGLSEDAVVACSGLSASEVELMKLIRNGQSESTNRDRQVDDAHAF